MYNGSQMSSSLGRILSVLRMSAMPIITVLFFFCSSESSAQFHSTPTRFSVVGQVLDYDGTVFFALSPANQGSPSLNFNNDKSYFTCVINGSTFFTNNQQISIPAPGYPNSYRLNSPDTIYNIADTVRAIWKNKDGVDIIQDAYPVEFPRNTC